MTDQDPTVDEQVAAAAAEGRAAALREVSARLVDAEMRAAAAGRPIDIDALLENIDRGKFLDDAGQPDRQRIAGWVERLGTSAGAMPAGPPHVPDLGQGRREMVRTQDPLTETLTKALGFN